MDEQQKVKRGEWHMGALTIKAIRTKNGSKIELPPVGVLCVVGGNNVGKSQFLRDIPISLHGPHRSIPTVLINEAEYNISISPESATDWFLGNSVEVREPGQSGHYRAAGGGTQPVSIGSFLQWFTLNPKPHLQPIMEWFVRTLDASQRSGVATKQTSMGSVHDHSSALQALFRDGDLEAALSANCKKVFGFALTLDRVNGPLTLRVGEPSVPSPPLQHPTKEYADDVQRLPSLGDQGDGVKNYIGMVLHLMTSPESVTILDEPEAFLHPAQARTLGRHLGQETYKTERQLITATHDRDFVLGLLDSKCPLTIMRINRDGDSNTFTSIDSSTISEIWSKPALRYSNLLQGLFHRTVVLCEGDADCHWYAAVADTIGQGQGVTTEEILFVPGGGKDQVPSSLAALHALDVSAFTITDFDSLHKPDYIKRVLSAKNVHDEEIITKVQSLNRVLDNDGKKKQAKESGLVGVPSGTATQIATDLISRLRDHKVLIVPTGELESFDRTVGGHGPSWVSAALNNRSHESSHEARHLVSPIVDSLKMTN